MIGQDYKRTSCMKNNDGETKTEAFCAGIVSFLAHVLLGRTGHGFSGVTPFHFLIDQGKY